MTEQDPGDAPERGFRISHLFDAPPDAVFAAWIEPDQVARWWRPEGLEIPRESVVIEPRVGGRFKLTMVEPDGPSYPLRAEFLEFLEPELIVIRSEPIPEPASPRRRSRGSSSSPRAMERGDRHRRPLRRPGAPERPGRLAEPGPQSGAAARLLYVTRSQGLESVMPARIPLKPSTRDSSMSAPARSWHPTTS